VSSERSNSRTEQDDGTLGPFDWNSNRIEIEYGEFSWEGSLEEFLDMREAVNQIEVPDDE
jgi:hypothetical protein